jgi:hypothetical protein
MRHHVLAGWKFARYSRTDVVLCPDCVGKAKVQLIRPHAPADVDDTQPSAHHIR